jgi:hypothetical protein
MAGKESFSPEEWARVVASPMVASMAITAADPSGLWGLMKEAFAGGQSLLAAKQSAGANPLAKAVADDITTPEVRAAARERMQTLVKGAQIQEIKGRAVEELRGVAALVRSKAPADAAGFTSWLREVAQKAAEAGKEGGFLGFGGVAVSDAEKATLEDIDAALASGEAHRSDVARINGQEAYAEGAAAFRNGKSLHDSPHQRGTPAGEEWASGFQDAANGTEALSPEQEE